MRTTDELEWDLTVDFVCVGAGAGGLAAAIAAVDAGASAFVANFARPLDRTSPGHLGHALELQVADDETSAYLAALIEDLDQPVATDGGVPVLAAGELVPVSIKKPGRRDQVPPFFGARLGDWAVVGVASPLGIVYSRAITDATTPKRSRSGAVVEVARIGSIELDPDAPAPALDQWLSSAANARGIDVDHQSRLRRLVFEEGQVVGAVFDTPTATFAVEARHGVMLACDADGAQLAPQVVSSVSQPTNAEVCLVREPLSRFSRIELHVKESSVQSFVSARGR
jgi:FAD binding domain